VGVIDLSRISETAREAGRNKSDGGKSLTISLSQNSRCFVVPFQILLAVVHSLFPILDQSPLPLRL
jgi:hypothetical protein